jgi:SAM-dependent methyltransferase
VIRSPNIWDTPQIYEVENVASDQAGAIDSRIIALQAFSGSVVVDLGCGSGFHLPRFAGYGARVIGVEPYGPLVAAARDRVRREGVPAEVLAGSADALPLADSSVDLIHARWAYFFGGGCEPGIAEAARVLRPGGLLTVIDNDATRSTFGSWFRSAYPAYDPIGVQRFWDRQGFVTEHLTIWWTFNSREDLEAVARIELPPEAAERALAAHEGTTVDYGIALRWKRF